MITVIKFLKYIKMTFEIAPVIKASTGVPRLNLKDNK